MANPINHSQLTNPVPIIPQETGLLDMPQDIVTQILTQLHARDLQTGSLVCREWNQMLKDDDIWRILFYNRFPGVKQRSIQNFQSAYKDLHSNPTKGVYASHTLSGHGGRVNSLAIFDGKLFSGSSDRTIMVWDLKTGECTATLTGHGQSVHSLAIFDGKLFSASSDNTIKVWDLETGECTATLTGHGESVHSVAVFEGKVFSGSADHTIKVWDLKKEKCTATLAHQWAVCSIAVFNGRLFSGSLDKTIKVWDLKTGECTATLTGHKDWVRSLAAFDGKLFSGSADNTIKVWDLETEVCIATLTGHGRAVHSVAVFDGKLFSGSADNAIKVWDLKTGQCTATLTGHGRAVCSLAVFDGKLFSGSADNTIKVWDFTADDRMIFDEIAKLLESQNQDFPAAVERFLRMPKTAKDAIYGKLYEILKPFANDYWGCGEHAFHNRHGQSSTRTQKARAIWHYLNDQPNKNNPLLLPYLGLKTEKEYSEKLNCRSGHLKKIGILSAEDVKLICLASPHFLKLDSLAILEVEEDFRDNKVKTEAQRRKTNLTMLMGQISELLEDKIEETNTCGVILYEGKCPWLSFQQKLKAFQAKLGEIAHKSNTAKSMVEAFHSKNYNGLADELNALVEEFQGLDRDHQISKLYAYVNQWGISTAWNILRSQGVQNLSALPESKQSLQKLFQMGE